MEHEVPLQNEEHHGTANQPEADRLPFYIRIQPVVPTDLVNNFTSPDVYSPYTFHADSARSTITYLQICFVHHFICNILGRHIDAGTAGLRRDPQRQAVDQLRAFCRLYHPVFDHFCVYFDEPTPEYRAASSPDPDDLTPSADGAFSFIRPSSEFYDSEVEKSGRLTRLEDSRRGEAVQHSFLSPSSLHWPALLEPTFSKMWAERDRMPR